MAATNQDFSIYQGDSKKLVVGVYGDGVQLTGSDVMWSMKRKNGAEVTKTSIDGGITMTSNIEFVINLYPQDTIYLSPGIYEQACKIIDTHGNSTTIFEGEVDVKAAKIKETSALEMPGSGSGDSEGSVISLINELKNQMNQGGGLLNMELFQKKDNEPDDSPRMQRLIDYCAENKVPLVLNGGLFYVWELDIPPGMTIIGNGATFKKPNLSAPPYNKTVDEMKWVRQVNVTYLGDVDSAPTLITGITFDGNCWEMWDEPSYDQEQASLLFCYADASGAGRLKIQIENCHFRDNVSDGIHLVTNVDADINNCSSFDCFRGGLTVSGGYTKINLNGFKSAVDRSNDGVDFEIDSPGYGGSYKIDANISNVQAETDFDFQLPDNSTGNVSGLILSKEKGRYMFGVGVGSVLNVINSTIAGLDQHSTGDRLLLSGQANFTNCRFYLREHETIDDPCFYIFSYDTENPNGVIGRDWTAKFTNCSFSYLGADYATQEKLGVDMSVSAVTRVTFEDCLFDKTLHAAVNAQIKQLELKNCHIDTFNMGVGYTSNDYWNPDTTVIFDNLEILNDTVQYFYLWGADCTVIHRNMTIPESRNKLGGNVFYSSVENSTYFQHFMGNRTIYVDHDPNTEPYVKGLIGDVAIHKTPQDEGKTPKWVCTRMESVGSPWNSVWELQGTSGGGGDPGGGGSENLDGHPIIYDYGRNVAFKDLGHNLYMVTGEIYFPSSATTGWRNTRILLGIEVLRTISVQATLNDSTWTADRVSKVNARCQDGFNLDVDVLVETSGESVSPRLSFVVLCYRTYPPAINTAPVVTSNVTSVTADTNTVISIPYVITDAEGGPQFVSLSVGDSSTLALGVTGANTWEVGTLPAGTHTLTIEARDNGDLWSEPLTIEAVVTSPTIDPGGTNVIKTWVGGVM